MGVRQTVSWKDRRGWGLTGWVSVTSLSLSPQPTPGECLACLTTWGNLPRAQPWTVPALSRENLAESRPAADRPEIIHVLTCYNSQSFSVPWRGILPAPPPSPQNTQGGTDPPPPHSHHQDGYFHPNEWKIRAIWEKHHVVFRTFPGESVTNNSPPS